VELSILVDFHNLFMMLDKDRGKTKEAIAEIVRMGRRRGTLVEARLFFPVYLYDEKSEPENRMWVLLNNLALSFGLTLEACPVSKIKTGGNTKLKDSVDACVFQHIIKNVHREIGPELIIIVTGDVDFAKFSAEAENRGKQTEFWSVDPLNTSRFIQQEKEFRGIKIPVVDFSSNPFVSSLSKKLKGLALNESERQMVRIVERIPNLALPPRDEEDMAILISKRLKISFGQSQQLLDTLVALGVAETKLAIRRVLSIDNFNVLFQHLQTTASKN
jgi:hypothetical protein